MILLLVDNRLTFVLKHLEKTSTGNSNTKESVPKAKNTSLNVPIIGEEPAGPKQLPDRLVSMFFRDLAHHEEVMRDPLKTPLKVRFAELELRGVLVSERNELENWADQVEARRVLGNILLRRMREYLDEVSEQGPMEGSSSGGRKN